MDSQPSDPTTASQAPTAAQNPRQITRVRLTSEAKALVNEHFFKNPYSTAAERKKLLDLIHQIPGNESYTLNSLNARLRAKRSQVAGPLSESNIAELTKLLNDTPQPTEHTVAIWAKGLDIPLERVQHWVLSNSRSTIVRSESYRPLTPAESTSPEPSPLGPKAESPAIAFAQVPHPVRSSPLIANPQPPAQLASSVSLHVPFHPATDKEWLLAAIAAAPSTTFDPPRNAAEFDALYSWSRVDQFVNQIRDGSLRDYGFHPHMLKGPPPS